MASTGGKSEPAVEARAFPTPNNLPVLRSPLVGREGELAAARDLLLRDDIGLLVLTGPGGVGKTRLALHLAVLLLDQRQFAGGVFFVNLAPVRDPALVVSTIAQTLGIKESREPLIESLKGYLQDKQMLLVLDNFEQVVHAASSVAEILASSPRLKILVTSRELLHVYCEYDYPVPPLVLPDPETLPNVQSLSQYEVIDLFMQRAQAVNPDFKLTDRNAAAVAEVCLRLDGLPLAVELAAARIQVLSPEELLARLKSKLKLLKGGARNLPERQQTLRATIDWSYNLLDEDEKKLFRRLGVFVGGCTLEAIEEVCGRELGGDSLDWVTSLVAKSLMLRQDGVGGESRFTMLETIREYAGEKLQESGEAEAIGDGHLDYFLQFAEAAEQELRGREQPVWVRRVDADLNNLRSALEWSLSRDQLAEKGLRVAGALARYWQTKGYLSEGRQWCEQLLSKTERTTQSKPSVERAKAIRALARMIFEQGNFIEARLFYEQSLEMSRALGDDWSVAAALNGLAPVALWLGEYDLSLSLEQEALAIFRRLGHKLAIADALSLTGTLLMLKEQYREAQQPLDEALAIYRELGDELGKCMVADQGSLAFHLGEYDKAKTLLEEGLGIARNLGVDWIIAKCLARLGVVAFRQSDPRQAEALSLEGLDRFRRSGNKRWTRWYLAALAEVARLHGMKERAAKLIGASEGLISAAGGHYEPGMRAEVERITADIRAELDEDSFTRLYEEGRSMSLEQVIAYATVPMVATKPDFTARTLSATTAAAEVQGRQTYPDGLTQREMEVLRLVASGKSNQDISEELVLSLRTVERHISNIYQKIGATGKVARATATVYALRHGLTA